MSVVPLAFGAALGTAAAYRAALHLLYGNPGPQRERFTARTADGASLALHRLRPPERRAAEPVILLHGLGANRYNLDFSPAPEHSLAEAYSRAGFDAWVLELRGAGASAPPPGRRDWTFEDYLEQDLPAAIELVLHHSGAQQVHWVGHSMGGMLLYAYLLGPHGAVVRSGVTMGSPVRFTDGARRFALELRMAWLLNVLRRVPVRQFTRWTAPLAGRVQHRFSAPLANWDNIEAKVLRHASYLATGDLAPSLAREFLRWACDGAYGTSDGTVSWTESLSKIQQPILVVAGGGDRLCLVPDVRFAYETLGGDAVEYLELSRAAGFGQDYGHIDLVFGRDAPRQVFPRLIDFVRRHDSGLARAAG